MASTMVISLGSDQILHRRITPYVNPALLPLVVQNEPPTMTELSKIRLD